MVNKLIKPIKKDIHEKKNRNTSEKDFKVHSIPQENQNSN